MKFDIIPKSPFNFDLTVGIHGRFPAQCVDLYSNGVYERVLRIGEKNYLVRVQSVGSVKKPRLSVETLPSPNEADKKAIKKKIRWVLGADGDLKEFYEVGLANDKFTPIIKKLYGLKAAHTPTIFEALIISITEQQLGLPVAIRLRRRLVERYGEILTVRGKSYHAFPTPSVLSRAKPPGIRGVGLSTKKAEYIINIAKRVAGGELRLKEVRDWSLEQVSDSLTKIKGVGPWTVEYMMLRGMGRYDAVPADDTALRSSVTEFLGEKKRVSAAKVRELLEPFGKYKGYAAFYLLYAYALQKYP